MSVMPPEKYMELGFLYKNSIGPGAVQSAKKQLGDFLHKNTDGHYVFACCAGSGLAQWAKHVLLEGIGDIALFLFSTYGLEKMEDLCRLLFITWGFARPIVLLVLPVIYWTWKVLHWFPWRELSLKNILGFDVSVIWVSIYSNESTLILVCFGWFWCWSVFFVDFGQNPHALFMHSLCTLYALFMRFIKSAWNVHKKCIKSG